jgi:hypothetical protein
MLLALALGIAGCTRGSTTPTGPCSGGGVPAFIATFPDPMTQPPAGSTGVATTIGSIMVPPGPLPDRLIGATLELTPTIGPRITGGVFTGTISTPLTATVPTLQPNTTYRASALGLPCNPFFDFGQFTTGST